MMVVFNFASYSINSLLFYGVGTYFQKCRVRLEAEMPTYHAILGEGLEAGRKVAGWPLLPLRPLKPSTGTLLLPVTN